MQDKTALKSLCSNPLRPSVTPAPSHPARPGFDPVFAPTGSGCHRLRSRRPPFPTGLFVEQGERKRRHGILFKEPNPRGSRPSDLIGLCRQHTKPDPPITQGEARRARKPVPIVSVNPDADPPQPSWFIQEGNRTPVSKATHSRYREGPVERRRCLATAMPAFSLTNLV